MVWVAFAASALVIVISGVLLARNAPIIAERTGIGRVWIGAVAMAAATSLPELVTDSTAVLRGAPELATGDLFGSNMVNMAILGVIALLYRGRRVIQREALGIALAAAAAIILTTVAAMFVVARLEHSIAGVVGLGTVLILTLAVGGLALLPGLREVLTKGEAPSGVAEQTPGLRRALAQFGGATLGIFVAAPVLVGSAESIVALTGLEATFVGVLVLAIITGLPELTASAAAVRLGELDLAVANLYGSNAVNMTMLVWLDVLYIRAPLLESVHIGNAVAGLVAVLLMMIGLTDMILRTERRRWPVDPVALVLLAGYLGGLGLVWASSSQ